MDDPRGILLKGYKLEERIGSGGFGAVYRAKQTTIEREVAVKIILPGFANNPDFIRRFEAEAQLVARLEHPHITPLIDYWRDVDGAYLVMRYLRGGSIRHALQKEQFEINSISQILDQLASALDFAHRNRVIHRDIKPGNILLDEDGNVYLADFGIAKDLAVLADNQTVADAVVGSLDYISPEQARSETVTPKTDIYSLGVTLYEMITGEHPFKDASSVERLYKHINDPLPEIDNLPDNLRETVNEIIQMATAKDPSKRYADVMALAVAFREGIGRSSTTRDLSLVEQLTMREQEILSLITDGLSNREIADRLVVTVSTIKWYITQLYKKLGVRSRIQAIVRARELNLVVDDMPASDINQLSQIDRSLPEPETPYKGLHAFQTNDSRDFFGRDHLIEKLIKRLNISNQFHRFLAIVGPSGSGKSSLVRAGVIPALWKDAIKGSEKWFIVDMIPGSHPIDKLETALIRVAANQANSLREQLQRDERGLLRVADIILPNDDTELVIVIDQFEEVFTLVEQESMRQHFLNLLLTAVSDIRSRIRVIVTLRADYYDRPLHYPEFGQLIRSQMETVLPLSAKDLERAIRGPAERVGVTFEQGLVEQIVSEMNYQSGALPLLQYALTELFDRRQGRLLTSEAYEQIGGAVGALANRADEIYQSLSDEGQELAHQMFMRMVTLGEGAEDTRKRTPQSDLLALTDNGDLVEEIIDQFAAYRLLSLDRDPETRQPTVEVAHEAILREWERLRLWLNESREEIRLQQQLALLTNEWRKAEKDNSFLLRGSRLEQFEVWASETALVLNQREQDFLQASIVQHQLDIDEETKRLEREEAQEQRSRNLLWALVAVFAVATLISGTVGIFAFIQRNEAIESEQDAFLAEQVAVASEQDALEALDIAQRTGLAFASNLALEIQETDLAIALAFESIGENESNLLPETERVLERIAASGGPYTWYTSEPGEVCGRVLSDDYAINLWLSCDNSEWAIWDAINSEKLISAPLINSDTLEYFWGFSKDNTQFLVARSEFGTLPLQLEIWDTQTLELTNQFALERYVIDVEWGADTHTFATLNTTEENMQLALNESREIADSVSIWDANTGELLSEFSFEGETYNSLALSMDGLYGAVGGWSGNGDPLVDNYRVILFDARTGERLNTFDRPAFHDGSQVFDFYLGAEPIGFSTDSRIIWFSGYPNYAIDIETGENFGYLHDLEGTRILRPPSADFTYVENRDNQDRQIFNLQTGELYDFESFGNVFIGGVPDTVTVQLQGRLNEIIGWEINGRDDEIFTYRRDALGQYLVAEYSPDGEYLAIISGQYGRFDNTETIILHTDTYEEAYRLDTTFNTYFDMSWSPDGRYIATTFDTGEIVLWDAEDGSEVRQLTGVGDAIRGLTFTNDSQQIIAGFGSEFESSEDPLTLFVWDVETGEIVRDYLLPVILSTHRGILGIRPHPTNDNIVAIAINEGFIPGNELIADPGNLRYYALNLNTAELTPISADVLLGSAEFTTDGTRLITASLITNDILVFDTTTYDVIQRWNSSEASNIGVAMSPDGQYLLTGSGVLASQSVISVWDIATGDLIRNYQGHDAQSHITSIHFNPDGTEFVSTATDGTTRVWNFDPTSSLDWIRENRVIRDLTCIEREVYHIQPLCDE